MVLENLITGYSPTAHCLLGATPWERLGDRAAWHTSATENAFSLRTIHVRSGSLALPFEDENDVEDENDSNAQSLGSAREA
jgi:hypothetical protein